MTKKRCEELLEMIRAGSMDSLEAVELSIEIEEEIEAGGVAHEVARVLTELKKDNANYHDFMTDMNPRVLQKIAVWEANLAND